MASSNAEERRQRRSQRRRQEILAAAAQVFAAKGYHNATTREIAAAADLAEGTIFNYFPSKRMLLVAVFEQSAEAMRKTIWQVDLRIPVAQSLTNLLERVLAFFCENRLYLQAIASEMWTDPELLRLYAVPRIERLSANLEGFLRLQISAGQLRPFDTQLGARLVLGMITALVLPIIRGVQPLPTPTERRRLAENIVGLLLNGVAR